MRIDLIVLEVKSRPFTKYNLDNFCNYEILSKSENYKNRDACNNNRLKRIFQFA